MIQKQKIFAINGSASKNSTNFKILNHIAQLTKNEFEWTIFDELSDLPHFDPRYTVDNVPETVIAFRDKIANADGVLICTPEYVFSIPSGLKNSLEWCVSTTIFSNKPLGIITASANGEKAHEQLQLIMQTLDATFTHQTTLLIQGAKGKIEEKGAIKTKELENKLSEFIGAYGGILKSNFRTNLGM